MYLFHKHKCLLIIPLMEIFRSTCNSHEIVGEIVFIVRTWHVIFIVDVNCYIFIGQSPIDLQVTTKQSRLLCSIVKVCLLYSTDRTEKSKLLFSIPPRGDNIPHRRGCRLTVSLYLRLTKRHLYQLIEHEWRMHAPIKYAGDKFQ